MDPVERQRQEEENLLQSVTQTGGLMAVAEIAKGILYTESFKTGLDLLR